jgi:hypothetical protein
MDSIVAILNLGVVGLGFLLAVLAYRLLVNPNLAPKTAANVKWFLAFSLAIVLLGWGSEWLRRSYDVEAVSDDVIALTTQVDQLKSSNGELAQQIGILREASGRLMTSSQASSVTDAAAANRSAKDYIGRIPELVERSCPGGSNGQNPANYPRVLNAANAARGQLDIVQSALDVCSQLAPPS